MCAQSKPPEITRSTEDYLKAIYKLGSGQKPAQTTAIAEALEVAPPSVTGMIKRLFDGGLVDYEPYKGAQLTDSGRRIAINMVRRHRILETYLTRKLGFSWDSVHDEAEMLEHAASDVLIERMARALGNPRFDPHGDPIPTENGEIDTPVTIPLTQVVAGTRAEFMLAADQSPERLRFVESLGLRPGTLLDVKEHQPFRGPVTIWVVAEEREKVVGHELAETLECRVVEGEA